MKAKTFRTFNTFFMIIWGLFCLSVFVYELTKIILPTHGFITLWTVILILIYKYQFRDEAWFVGIMAMLSILSGGLYLYWNASTETIYQTPQFADRETIASALTLSVTVPIFLGSAGILFIYVALSELFDSKQGTSKKKRLYR
ncbi:MAG: hypothetical protein ABII72_00965 [Parcubacteria group bacterium]